MKAEITIKDQTGRIIEDAVITIKSIEDLDRNARALRKCIYSKTCERFPNCPKGKGDNENRESADYSCWIPLGLPKKLR